MNDLEDSDDSALFVKTLPNKKRTIVSPVKKTRKKLKVEPKQISIKTLLKTKSANLEEKNIKENANTSQINKGAGPSNCEKDQKQINNTEKELEQSSSTEPKQVEDQLWQEEHSPHFLLNQSISFICPLCGKNFDTKNAHVSHVKQCAKKKKLTTQQLMEALDKHKEQMHTFIGGKQQVKQKETDMKAKDIEMFTLNNQEWLYRGEGNANLVIAVIKLKKILRLRKLKCLLEEEELRQQAETEIHFANKFILPLLSQNIYKTPSLVKMDLLEIKQIEYILKEIRPTHREQSGAYNNFAALLPDLTLLPDEISNNIHPVFAVEIKPKQGWTPQNNGQLSKCSFCLKQYLKLKKGAVKHFSKYCPLDLFSGDTDRMKHSIKCLLDTPQNNIKIFKNGLIIYGDGTDICLDEVLKECFGDFNNLMDKFCDLVVNTLLYSDNNDNIISLSSKCDNSDNTQVQTNINELQQLLPEPACNWNFKKLPKFCVLNKISNIQKLDKWTIEEHYEMYKKNTNKIEFFLNNSDNSCLEPLFCHILATSANDCSIMLTFQQSNKNNKYYYEDADGCRFVFQIGVLDMDLKPISCVLKHHIRNRKIIESCIQTLKNKD